MVHTSSSSLGDDARSVSRVLNRSVEEFPGVETEIVGVREVRRTVVAGLTGRGGEEEAGEFSPDSPKARHRRRRSARFSLFHWFKKTNPDRTFDTGNKEELEETRGTNSTQGETSVLEKLYSSSGSVDTTCSTATVNSFTFRPGPDLRERRSFHFQRQFDSEPLINGDNCGSSLPISDNEVKSFRIGSCRGLSRPEITAGNKGEEAALCTSDANIGDNKKTPKLTPFDYRSLPTSGKTADLAGSKKRLAHVRGKRRAPEPPGRLETGKKIENNSTHTARRKRQAPKPPDKEEVCSPSEGEKCVSTDRDRMSKKESQRANNKPKNADKSLAISNDTLKLEGGVLRAKISPQSGAGMSDLIVKPEGSETGKKSAGLTKNQISQVAPRPWYKRSNTTLSERDICGSFRREVLKIPTLTTKSRDKGVIHNPDRDSGTAELANSFDKSFSRLNHFFGRSERREDQSSRSKRDEKRKSTLSILTNISELDREAAAIVQEEQARNQAIIARSFSNAAGNSDSDNTNSEEIISDIVSASIEPQRRGTRALISKFNAISNITKVTVNATFFAKSSQPQSASKNDRIVTKRLLCDGAELQVNETPGADVSSINFFRRLEAEASQTQNEISPAAGWEEKIKRYFPERGEPRRESEGEKRQNRYSQQQFSNVHLRREDPVAKDFPRTRQSRNVDHAFEFIDHRNAQRRSNVEKIEHLSRADLKEMLIEMKHSLPKRPKQKPTGKSSEKNDDVKIEIIEDKPRATTSNRLGKPETRSSPAKKNPQIPAQEITAVVDRTKVSSAAQTSANLRKLEPLNPREKEKKVINDKPRSKPFPVSSKSNEDTIYTTKGRKNSGGTALSRNTFQLIRPRDFACIEALKTDKGVAKEGQNTYMNVIEDSIYANTVICPVKISGDNVTPMTGSRIDEKSTKFGDPEVQHYTANVIADVRVREEPSRPETRAPGLENIGGTGDGEKPVSQTNMNTMAINRLLRKLEGAIASGQHQQAAGLAKELAQLKIHCSVVRQRSGNIKAADFINVDMYIEDKLAHQGPIPLQLSLNTTVAELKKKVFAEFEIPSNVQRWIIGKNLADNDDFTLNELKAVDKSSIFLYLVAPDLQNDETPRAEKQTVKEEVTEVLVDEEPREIVPIVEEEPEIVPEEEPTVEELKLKRYEHLMSLENSDVIPNSVPIECPICFLPYGPCEGVILRDCLHMFCRTCIANTIMYCEEAEVKCPFRDSEYTCESTLQEREIKALVTAEIYEQHLAKSVSQAENSAGNNAFHCKTPDCRGWCIYDDNVNVFQCPVCGVNNCLTCQAIHTNKNCREYQDEIRLLKETDQETKRTAAVLEEMVESGEALACPTCAVVLMKKWGCDWLRCSMCKTEICWVTRGPRWGPAGKGDTSGGCKCGENGVKCHPRCNYCH